MIQLDYSNNQTPNTDTDIKQANRGRILVRLIYLQALFLIFAYVIGVWQALIIHQATIISPYIISHAFMAGSFAALSGTIGLLARFQDLKNVSNLNLGLFFITVFGGASGLAYLGDQIGTIRNITNLSMITVIGVGMPITGYSLAQILGKINTGKEEIAKSALTMGYLSLGSMSLHFFMGVGIISTHFYDYMFFIHILFAALTAALVLGTLIFSIQTRSKKGNTQMGITKTSYFLLALTFTVASAAAGASLLILGAVYFIIEMAEIAIVAYGFTILGIRELYRQA
jgi:hypothetical protein